VAVGLEISRRLFLAFAGGALVLPRIIMGEESVPPLLDHILLGCNDLQRGIDFVEEHTGVRAALGGVHPGRGTRNALLSLGQRRYLEIIVPDPGQPDAKDPLAIHLRELSEPRIVGWAVHPGDLDSFAKKIGAAGVAFEGPTPGSRKRPDGRVLQWRSLTLKENSSWLLPFFIEWSVDSKHPSEDAPHGCKLESFAAVGANPDGLLQVFKTLGVEVPAVRGVKEQLLAKLSSSKGSFEISS
jgi:catechol 2,3-dioxygenase-like lactoylglutathione lyase family enzyme